MAGSESGLRVPGIVGSLRRATYNRRPLEAAKQVAPQGVEIDIVEAPPGWAARFRAQG